MVILPIIVGSLALAVITVLNRQSTVSSTLVDSADSRLASTFFSRDVQSATLVATSTVTTPAQCGSGNSLVVGLAWNGGLNVASYWQVTQTSGSSPANQLVRSYCASGSLTAQSMTLVQNLSPTQVGAVLSCGSTCAATNGWVPAAGVSQVSLSLSQPKSSSQYGLLAVPRVWTPTSGGTLPGGYPPPPPLLLLGTSGNVISIGGNNNAISTNGSIMIDSNSSGAISLAGSSTVTSTGSFLIYGCTPSAGNCTDGAVSTSGGGNTFPQPAQLSTPYPDPDQGLPYPTPPTSTATGCSKSVSTWTCTPGIYVTPPSFTGSSQTINFQPGNYLFQSTSPLSITGANDAITFGSGIYIFNGGLSVHSSGQTIGSGAGGVMFFIGNTASAPGNTGDNTASVTLGASSITLNLSAMTTGTYAGVLLFQNRTDVSGLTLNGSASAITSYSGTIYAPAAQVSLQGSGGAMNLQSILAASVSIGGSSTTITLGP